MGSASAPGNGVFAGTAVSPQHASCAIFSAIGCPFLRYGRSRARRSGAVRGGMIIVGFRQFGVRFIDSKHAGYGYVEPADVIPCDGGPRDLLGFYEAAVEADTVDTTSRLYWSDGALADCVRVDDLMLDELSRKSLPFAPGNRLAVL
jgi:hypothetical protein